MALHVLCWSLQPFSIWDMKIRVSSSSSTTPGWHVVTPKAKPSWFSGPKGMRVRGASWGFPATSCQAISHWLVNQPFPWNSRPYDHGLSTIRLISHKYLAKKSCDTLRIGMENGPSQSQMLIYSSPFGTRVICIHHHPGAVRDNSILSNKPLNLTWNSYHVL